MVSRLRLATLAALLFVVAPAFSAESLDSSGQAFLKSVASINYDIVDLAKLGASKAVNADLKMFGESAEKAHLSIGGIGGLATTLGVTIPKAEHSVVYTRLNNLSGASFDTEFVKAEADDHSQFVNLLNNEIKTGTNAQLKDFATGLLPHVQTHLATLKDWENRLASGKAVEKATEVKHEGGHMPSGY